MWYFDRKDYGIERRFERPSMAQQKLNKKTTTNSPQIRNSKKVDNFSEIFFFSFSNRVQKCRLPCLSVLLYSWAYWPLHRVSLTRTSPLINILPTSLPFCCQQKSINDAYSSADEDLSFHFQFLFSSTFTMARLTRFEWRSYKKFPKGPPFACVFWKISKGSPLCLCFLKKFPKGPPFACVFWKNFQRVPPLLIFFEKFQKKNCRRGEYWLFLSSPSIWR